MIPALPENAKTGLEIMTVRAGDATGGEDNAARAASSPSAINIVHVHAGPWPSRE